MTYRICPDTLAGILFGGFAKNKAKLILAVFNLAVAERIRLLFADNAPPINQNHACTLANYMEMHVIDSYLKGHHVSKHYWTLTNRETFVCKRKPEKATNAYDVAVIVIGHVPIKISEVCFCAETESLFM